MEQEGEQAVSGTIPNNIDNNVVAKPSDEMAQNDAIEDVDTKTAEVTTTNEKEVASSEASVKEVEVEAKKPKVVIKLLAKPETPSKVTEVPTKAIESPTKVMEIPTKTTEIPTKVTEVPTKVTEVPTKVTEVPTKVTEVPTKVTEVPTKVTEIPSTVKDSSTKVLKVPTKVTEVPTKVTEIPSTVKELPTKVLKVPIKVVEVEAKEPEVVVKEPDVVSDEPEVVPTIKEDETDEQALQRREKQIELGKSTPEYDRYLREVPLEERGSPKEHPRTPDLTKKYSRRVWDGLIKSWRRSLHKWDAPLEEQKEVNPKELAKRLKHLASVKQTKQYEKYSAEVTKETRIEGEHPMTPDHTRKYASQQEWFAHIKIWRENLSKYEPDWSEIISAPEPVEPKKLENPIKKLDNPIRKSVEEPTIKTKEKNPVRKPIEFSHSETQNPGKATVTANPVKVKSGNEEKAPKRKPIIFDLKEDAETVVPEEVKPILADPEQVKRRLNKFKILDKVVEEEKEPGVHQDDEDLIILDETEEEVDVADEDQSKNPTSIFDRLGGKVVVEMMTLPAKPEVDLRVSLRNKKPLLPVPSAYLPVTSVDLMRNGERAFAAVATAPVAANVFEQPLRRRLSPELRYRTPPRRPSRSRSRSHKRRHSSSRSSSRSRRRRRRSSSRHNRRSRSHSRRSRSRSISRNRDPHTRGRSFSPARPSGGPPPPQYPPVARPAPGVAPAWVPPNRWSVPPPTIYRPVAPFPTVVQQPPQYQPRPVQPTMSLPLPRPTTLYPSTALAYQAQPSWAGQSSQPTLPTAPGVVYPTALNSQVGPPPAKGLDFNAIALMNPGEEMLRYIQSKSYDYARELDAKHPDFRRMVGRIVDNQIATPGQKVLPCGPYNKSDSCPYKGLAGVCHPGPVGVSIHACSLCYFCLGGLFNFHRQTICPLLATLT